MLKHNKQVTQTQKNFEQTNKFLEKPPEILIMKSDEENSTVLMPKEEYMKFTSSVG